MDTPVITVFGGTGFVGQAIVRRAAKLGWTVRVATRRATPALDMTQFEAPERIIPTPVNYDDDQSLERAIAGSDYVIYSIGLLFEKGKSRFQAAHVDYPERIAKIAGVCGVTRLIHISAIACDLSQSNYAKTKLAGERALQTQFPHVTILRPSLIFGAGDGFFNLFADMLRYAPALPLFGGGTTRFQPVHVDDVAEAVVRCCTDDKTKGIQYDIAGADIYSFSDLLKIIMDATGRHVPLIPVPFAIARIQAVFLSLLPKPLLTQDQVTSLQTDALADPAKPGLSALGISPADLKAVVPHYLARFHRNGGRCDS